MFKAILKIIMVVCVGAVMLFGTELIEFMKENKPGDVDLIQMLIPQEELTFSELALPELEMLKNQDGEIVLKVGSSEFAITQDKFINEETKSALDAIGLTIGGTDEFGVYELGYKGKTLYKFKTGE